MSSWQLTLISMAGQRETHSEMCSKRWFFSHANLKYKSPHTGQGKMKNVVQVERNSSHKCEETPVVDSMWHSNSQKWKVSEDAHQGRKREIILLQTPWIAGQDIFLFLLLNKEQCLWGQENYLSEGCTDLGNSWVGFWGVITEEIEHERPRKS